MLQRLDVTDRCHTCHLDTPSTILVLDQSGIAMVSQKTCFSPVYDHPGHTQSDKHVKIYRLHMLFNAYTGRHIMTYRVYFVQCMSYTVSFNTPNASYSSWLSLGV